MLLLCSRQEYKRLGTMVLAVASSKAACTSLNW